MLLLLSSLLFTNCSTRARQPVASLSANTESTRARETAISVWDDSDEDGFPELLELRSANDRENFRSWFTRIAETQYYSLSQKWNKEQRDCAGLVRFAFREALRRHDHAWFETMGAVYEPVAPDVESFDLDNNKLGEKIFRTRYGSFSEEDLKDNTFSEFVDANSLKNFNTVFFSRDWRRSEPGDLIFFYQPWVQKFPFHVMIFLGSNLEASDGMNDWVVYHTGATATDAGVMKNVRLAELNHHPDKRWHPIANNKNFLGVYRFRILN